MITRAANRWGGFVATAIVYMLIQGITDFYAWHSTIGEAGWNAMTDYQIVGVVCKVSLSMFIILRSLQNGSFQEAKDEPTPSTKIELK